MSLPVIEQIGAFLERAMSDVTQANGYSYTLTSTRAKRFLLADQPLADLTAYIMQGGSDQNKSPVNPATGREPRVVRQKYFIWIVVLQSDEASECIDTKLNYVCADVIKKLCEDPRCGGYAKFLDIVSTEATDIPETGILITVEILYAVQWADPYVLIH